MLAPRWRKVLRDEPDIRVADYIVLKIEGEEYTWYIVGIVKGTPPRPLAYVKLPYFAGLIGAQRDAGRRARRAGV